MTNRKSSPLPAFSADSGNKLLFAFPEIVRDLLIGYAPGEWVTLLRHHLPLIVNALGLCVMHWTEYHLFHERLF